MSGATATPFVLPSVRRAEALVDTLGVAALLLGFRLLGLDRLSLWHDEIFVRFWAAMPQAFLWGEGRLLESNPPLYFSIVHAWTGLLGQSSDWALRLPSALVSAGAGAACYGIGRSLGGRRLGLLSALAFALLPMAAHFAQEARPVALLPLFEGLCFLGMTLRLCPENRARTLGMPMFLLGAVAAIHSHATAALFVAAGLAVAAAASLLRRGGPDWRGLLAWVWTGVAVLLLCLPQFLVYAAQTRIPTLDWIPPFGPATIFTFLTDIVAQGSGGGRRAMIAAVTLYAVAAGGAWRLGYRRALPLVGVPLVFAGLPALFSLQKNIMLSRGASGLTVPLVVLLAAAAQGWRRPALRFGMPVLALGLPALLLGLQSTRITKDDFRGFVAAVEQDDRCRGPVFAESFAVTSAWAHYAAADRSAHPLRLIDWTGGIARNTTYPTISALTGDRFADLEELRSTLAGGQPVIALSMRGTTEFMRAAAASGAVLAHHAAPFELEALCLGPSRAH